MKTILISISALLLSLTSFATIGPITGYSTICLLSQPIYLNDTTSGGSWSSSNTAVATIDGVWMYNASVNGISTGTATITYSFGSNFVTKTIHVYPAPSPITGAITFDEGGSTTLYDTTTGGGNWQDIGFFEGYSGTYGATSMIITSWYTDSARIVSSPTWYSVPDEILFTDTFGCSTYVEVSVNRGVQVRTLFAPPHNEVVIYPNPATTFLTITSCDMITYIAISNLLGQTVYSNNYHTDQVQIDVADLPKGIYLVKINDTEVRKFIKE